eukprot:9501000-Pyramimonas_sp.AAC.1
MSTACRSPGSSSRRSASSPPRSSGSGRRRHGSVSIAGSSTRSSRNSSGTWVPTCRGPSRCLAPWAAPGSPL